MKLLNVTQGSDEWLAARAAHLCASDAPAMLGLSKYKTRTQLLTEKKTGITPEVDAGTQMLFDMGHEAEAMARPIAEEIIADELYPAVGTLETHGLKLLASFDGLTMLEDKIFEHKLFNASLADFIRTNQDLPDSHWPQVEHQLLVSGADECLFITSNGREGEQFEHITYFSKPERRAALVAGWKQFVSDLETFEPQAETVKPVAAPVETLPAVVVQVTGSLSVNDNLSRFDAALREYLGRINKSPETDQDFADCESAVKTLKAAEDALDAASSATIAQVEPVANATRAIETLRELARTNRLQLEKIVKVEKDNRKLAMVTDAQCKASAHWQAAAKALSGILPQIPHEFPAVINGLKSIDSMRDKLNGALANYKIAVNEAADKIRTNAELLNAESAGYEFLFNDRASLLLRDADFIRLTVQSRISEHKEEQARREEEMRARIQAEVAAIQPQTVAQKSIQEEVTPVAPQRTDEGARVTLGQINSRLAPLSVDRQILAAFGFQPVGRAKAAHLFKASDMPGIRDALINHISNMDVGSAE